MGPDATAWMTALSTYPSYNLELTLSIATLNTCQHMVASDLAATHWNDPALMLRFQYLLNWLWLTAYDAGQTGLVISLAIGNEVDVLPSTNMHSTTTRTTQPFSITRTTF